MVLTLRVVLTVLFDPPLGLNVTLIVQVWPGARPVPAAQVLLLIANSLFGPGLRLTLLMISRAVPVLVKVKVAGAEVTFRATAPKL